MKRTRDRPQPQHESSQPQQQGPQLQNGLQNGHEPRAREPRRSVQWNEGV